ncbi:ESX secretion-associated protein EspG [Nocardia sp. NPDC024068]|uniref:ESX secretion-associated protein EspG n=1 Tax=Nocardia sp. NPDC024068 TaxID=3157197 RepID=UPI003409B666
MTHTWKLSDLEFLVAWERDQADLLPEPFIFTSRTPLYEDFRSEKAAVREQLRTGLDPAVDQILEIIARPDIRIVVHGWTGDPGDAAARIRLLGVRRGNAGYLVKQLPGETVWHGGGYVISEADPMALSELVAAELPESGAGTREPTILRSPAADTTMDYAYGRSAVISTFEESEEELAEQFLNIPVTGHGTITVIQGYSRFGPRGICRHGLHWRDLREDGRYLIPVGDPLVATPADRTRLAGAISEATAAVVAAIRDERQ